MVFVWIVLARPWIYLEKAYILSCSTNALIVDYSSCCAPICFTSRWVQSRSKYVGFLPDIPPHLARACHHNRLPSRSRLHAGQLERPREYQLTIADFALQIRSYFAWQIRTDKCTLNRDSVALFHREATRGAWGISPPPALQGLRHPAPPFSSLLHRGIQLAGAMRLHRILLAPQKNSYLLLPPILLNFWRMCKSI